MPPTARIFRCRRCKMMIEMSRLANEYGLDVWIWYPAMDADYSDPKTVEFALKEWGEVFRQLPRIDAVFVPGGDPGHTEPKHLMALLEKQTAVLHRYHPKAQMWVSPQSFDLRVAGRVPRHPQEPAAGMAQRRRVRTAGADEPAAAARSSSAEVSDPPLSRHHAQPPGAISGAGLGRGLCASPRRAK